MTPVSLKRFKYTLSVNQRFCVNNTSLKRALFSWKWRHIALKTATFFFEICSFFLAKFEKRGYTYVEQHHSLSLYVWVHRVSFVLWNFWIMLKRHNWILFMQNLRSSRKWLSSGMSRFEKWWIITDVFGERAASIFRVEELSRVTSKSWRHAVANWNACSNKVWSIFLTCENHYLLYDTLPMSILRRN
jgi:hypothetical protein